MAGSGGDIDYDSYGVGLVATLPDNVDGFAVLGKVGYGEINNCSNSVPFREVKGSQIYTGVGIEYQFNNDLSFRGEYDYIDKDAQMITMSLVKRFGGKEEKHTPPPVAPTPTATKVIEPAPAPHPHQRRLPELLL